MLTVKQLQENVSNAKASQQEAIETAAGRIYSPPLPDPMTDISQMEWAKGLMKLIGEAATAGETSFKVYDLLSGTSDWQRERFSHQCVRPNRVRPPTALDTTYGPEGFMVDCENMTTIPGMFYWLLDVRTQMLNEIGAIVTIGQGRQLRRLPFDPDECVLSPVLQMVMKKRDAYCREVIGSFLDFWSINSDIPFTRIGELGVDFNWSVPHSPCNGNEELRAIEEEVTKCQKNLEKAQDALQSIRKRQKRGD